MANFSVDLADKLYEYESCNAGGVGMKNDLLEAKMLASSIASALAALYEFNVMHKGNTLEENDKSNNTLFVIQAASERLSEMMEVIA